MVFFENEESRPAGIHTASMGTGVVHRRTPVPHRNARAVAARKAQQHMFKDAEKVRQP